jgi:hypothetical protein
VASLALLVQRRFYAWPVPIMRDKSVDVSKHFHIRCISHILWLIYCLILFFVFVSSLFYTRRSLLRREAVAPYISHRHAAVLHNFTFTFATYFSPLFFLAFIFPLHDIF